MTRTTILFDTPVEARAFLEGFRARSFITTGVGEQKGKEVVFTHVPALQDGHVHDMRKPIERTISREILDSMVGMTVSAASDLAASCGMNVIITDIENPPKAPGPDVLWLNLEKRGCGWPVVVSMTNRVVKVRADDPRQVVD